MCWMWYSPLTGATRQPQQIGHNPTWPWGSPAPASPSSLVHLHRSEQQTSNSELIIRQRSDEKLPFVHVTWCESNWPEAWSEESLRWPTWSGPTGWIRLPGGAWATRTSPPWSGTWLARYLLHNTDIKPVAKKRKSSASWNGNCRDLRTTKGSILDPVYVSWHEISAFASFPVRTRGWCACRQSSGRSIKHLVKHHWFSSLAHGSWRSSHLTIFLMALACHIALTNSVYLQQHHATLCTCCQLVRFCPSSQNISSCRNPKHESIPSYAGSRRLGAQPIHRTATGSLNTTVKYGFSVIGEQGYIETSWHAAHFSCSALRITTPWLKWERRERKRERERERERGTNGRHMRQKRAVTTHPLFGA